MRDYAALEALAAQSPRLNDMRITTPKGTLSMRSDFGLWLQARLSTDRQTGNRFYAR